MSETESPTSTTPPPVAETPPPLPLPPGVKSGPAEISAAFEAYADRLVPHAAEQLAKLWGDLPLLDPAILGSTIETRLQSPAYEHFLKPTPAPAIGTAEWFAMTAADNAPRKTVVGADGKVYRWAGGLSPAQERARAEAHAAAEQRRQEGVAWAKHLASLPPAERLMAIAGAAKRYRDGQDATKAANQFRKPE